MRALKTNWPWLLVSSVLGALVALQTYAWRTWLREAPLARQNEATQAIAARLVAQEGPDVAAFTLPAPPLLTSVVMVCWLLIPSLLWVVAIGRSAGTDALHITSLKLWGRFALLLGFCFAVATVASASLPSALPWTQHLEWAASYCTRTAIYALPFAALLAAIASVQRIAAAWVSRG